MVGYIGKEPTVGNFIKLDSITTSATTTFNLLNGGVAYSPESARVCQVSLNGVIQNPETAFNIVGSTIVFSQALTSDDVIDYILVLGDVMSVGTPSDATVSTAKIVDSAVTTAKINDDAVTEAKLNLISTSSVPSLEAKGDGSSDGYIQLNCSQNSHGIKLKSPPHSANQNYSLVFPSTAPATDKFLKTDSSGNLSFAEAGGGGMDLVASVEGTNSVGDVSINDCFSSTYANYLITFAINNDRSGNTNNFRFQADDDSTFDNNYNYCLWGYRENGTLSTSFSNSGSTCPLNTAATPDDDSWVFGSCTGYMYVYHPYTLSTGGLRRTRAIGQIFSLGVGGNVYGFSLQMQLKQNSYNVAGIRFRPSANYITERRVRVYGLKDS